MSQFARMLMPPSGLLTSLTSYWKLEETGASARVDAVGSFNLTAANSPGNTTGVIGNAVDFVAASSQALFNTAIPTTTQSTMSLSVWLKRSSTSNPLSLGWCDTVGHRFCLLLIGTAAFGAAENSASQSFNQYSNSLTGAYHHYVLVFDGGQATATDRIKLYVDGALATPSVNTGTLPTTYAITGPLRVGRDFGSGTYSTGQEDEIGLWIGRALSAADAKLLYGGGAPVQYPFGGIP